MSKKLVAVLFIFFALIAACGGSKSSSLTTTPFPRETPTVFLTPTLFPGTLSPTSETIYPTHPPDTRTGILQIDQVIADFLSGDADAQWGLLNFIKLGCTHLAGYREAPPCREGEEEGALVEVFPFLGTVGSHSQEDELGDWDGIEMRGLYAVFTPSENMFRDIHYPIGEYVVAFIGSTGRDVQMMHVDADGRVVRIDWQWVDTNSGFSIEYSADEIVLGLPDSYSSDVRITETPVYDGILYHDSKIRTGIEDVDMVIEIILSGDIEQVMKIIQFSDIPCIHGISDEISYGYPPVCYKGEENGEIVQALPVVIGPATFIREDQMYIWKEKLEALDGIYSVYIVSGQVYSEKYYPIGDYVIAFAEGYELFLFYIEDGKIVRLDTILAYENSYFEFDPMVSEIILAPLE